MTRALFLFTALVFVGGIVMIFGTGCPSSEGDMQKLIAKVLSNDGCQGCSSCEPKEGEGEEIVEGEVVIEGEGETSVTVRSVTIGSFSPTRVLPGGSVSNSGKMRGTGTGMVKYHWGGSQGDGSAYDSGEKTVQMTNGSASIPSFSGFPTSKTGLHRMHVEVTSPTSKSSGTTDYMVIENIGSDETVLLPGDVPLEMIWIPGGTYDMGRYPSEWDSYYLADPLHSVTVSGFWLGKYEVTKAQWTTVMGTTPWSGQSYVLNDPNSPAVYVSWNDARAFTTALNNTYPGKIFRLPSEAEWEYACRAGTTTRFYWGDDLEYIVGNAYCCWQYNTDDVGESYAHVVGLKLPNAFGLFDMSGNLWELNEDDWHSRYTNAPVDGNAWVDSPRAPNRVVRGGAWHNDGSLCRSWMRLANEPSDTGRSVGFRLCR